MSSERPPTGPAGNPYQQPWEVIDSKELARLRAIAALAKMLERGCWCEYDYRCGTCDTIVNIKELL